MAVIPIGAGNSLIFVSNLGNFLAVPGSIVLGHVTFNATDGDAITNFGVNFNCLVHLTDVDSGDSADVRFTGEVSGTAHGGGSGAITSSLSNLASTPGTATLGDFVYSLGWDSTSTAPTGSGSAGEGTLKSTISARRINSSVSEPGNLALLAGIGIPAALVIRRRR